MVTELILGPLLFLLRKLAGRELCTPVRSTSGCVGLSKAATVSLREADWSPLPLAGREYEDERKRPNVGYLCYGHTEADSRKGKHGMASWSEPFENRDGPPLVVVGTVIAKWLILS